MLTQERVRELFDYRQDGFLLWKRSTGAAKGGSEAGCQSQRRGDVGYKSVRIDTVLYRYHRVVYLWHRGEIPDLIDHINADPSDNRIENLRPIDRFQNQWNRKRSARGVSFNRSRGCWRVQIMARGERFDALCESEDEALLIAAEARRRMHQIC